MKPCHVAKITPPSKNDIIGHLSDLARQPPALFADSRDVDIFTAA